MDCSTKTAVEQQFQRTEIMIEIEEITVVSRGRNLATHAWCPQCSATVMMVMPEQAAALMGTSVRAINRRVENESVHFVETQDGWLRVCANSLD